MSKRTDSIVAVTIARYATVYVEAETPQEAAKIVEDNIDEIYDAMPTRIDDQFEESEMDVCSYEAYTTDAEDYMDYIWADGEAKSFDQYMDELEEDEK